jgi:hypothetical protein
MRTLVLAVLALIPSVSLAQPCTPTLRGPQSGPIDMSPNIQSFVGAMTVFDDGGGPGLIAAGQFNLPPIGAQGPTASVGRYRAGSWAPMQTGLPPSTSQAMRTLAQADLSASGGPGFSLYVAGDFSTIYRWTGTTWTGTGSVSGATYSLLPFSDAQGPVLLAGGNYGVRAWRGSGVWTPYANLTSTGTVYALRIVDDGSGPALFAMGNMHDAAHGIDWIARFDGVQWNPYNLGLTFVEVLTDMTTFDDGVNGPELYIAGRFGIPNTANAGVARRHNGVWEIIAGEAFYSDGSLGPNFFKVDEGQGERLYVGGVFTIGGQPAGLARLTPTGWQATYLSRSISGPTSPSGSVRSLARFDDGAGARTYLGGTFASFRTDPSPTAPAVPAFGLMRSGSPGFEPIAQGLGELANQPPAQIRYSLSVVDLGQGPRLFAASQFLRAGGQLARGAAAFDGNAWTPFSLPNTTQQQGVQFGATATIAGQRRLLSYIFGSSLGPIAYWNGAAWVRLTAQPPGTGVYAMATFNNTAYVLSDGGLSHYNGASWTVDISGPGAVGDIVVGDIGRGQRLYVAMSGPMGPGLYEYDGAIYARLGPNLTITAGSSLAIHDDGGGPALYLSGSGLPGYFARFQNNAFVPIMTGGFGISGPGPVAMASFHDGRGPALYIAGPLSSAGGLPTNGLLRWHAGSVANVVPYSQSYPPGFQRPSMAVLGNRLYIAGEFYNIGNVTADHLAYIEACPRTCTADFNYDGDVATDADIEAFFACLAGNCCANCASADFNGDGEVGNDADIESFFRVLAGGPC